MQINNRHYCFFVPLSYVHAGRAKHKMTKYTAAKEGLISCLEDGGIKLVRNIRSFYRTKRQHILEFNSAIYSHICEKYSPRKFRNSRPQYLVQWHSSSNNYCEQSWFLRNNLHGVTSQKTTKLYSAKVSLCSLIVIFLISMYVRRKNTWNSLQCDTAQQTSGAMQIVRNYSATVAINIHSISLFFLRTHSTRNYRSSTLNGVCH